MYCASTTLSTENSAVTRVLVEEIDCRLAWKVPIGDVRYPTPSATETLAVVPALYVHAPPVSAVPQPLATARPKSSLPSSDAVGATTVTTVDAVPVAPWLSVTVNVTVYEPAAAYGCDTDAPEPAGDESPKSQLYEAIDPSES